MVRYVQIPKFRGRNYHDSLVSDVNNPKFGSPFRILLGSDIELAVNADYLKILPFNSKRIQPTSIDIAISKVLNYPNDSKDLVDFLTGDSKDFHSLELGPSQSILFISEEHFSFPNDMFAEIFLRSRYSRILNCHGHMGRIECGWKGYLVLEVTNQSSHRTVTFTKGDDIATLVIYQIENTSPRSYSGIFQNWK